MTSQQDAAPWPAAKTMTAFERQAAPTDRVDLGSVLIPGQGPPVADDLDPVVIPEQGPPVADDPVTVICAGLEEVLRAGLPLPLAKAPASLVKVLYGLDMAQLSTAQQLMAVARLETDLYAHLDGFWDDYLADAARVYFGAQAGSRGQPLTWREKSAADLLECQPRQLQRHWRPHILHVLTRQVWRQLIEGCSGLVAGAGGVRAEPPSS